MQGGRGPSAYLFAAIPSHRSPDQTEEMQQVKFVAWNSVKSTSRQDKSAAGLPDADSAAKGAKAHEEEAIY